MDEQPGWRMRADMSEQAHWLRGVPGRRDELVQALGRPRSQDARVWTLARGSSAHAATMVRPWLSRACGRPVGALDVGALSRPAGVPPPAGDVVLVVSQSGRTPDVVSAAWRLREAGCHVVALVNEPGAVAAEASAVVELGVGSERSVPATKSVLAQVALLWTFGVLLAERHGRSAPPIGAGTSDAVAGAVADAGPVERVVQALASSVPVAGTGRGATTGLAAEWAHKTMETSGLPIFSASAAELAHGPVAVAGPGRSVVGFADTTATEEDVREALDRAAARGAATVLVGPGGDIPTPDHPVDGLLTALVRAQMLAEAFARARGSDPDEAFGLSKVTSTR